MLLPLLTLCWLLGVQACFIIIPERDDAEGLPVALLEVFESLCGKEDCTLTVKRKGISDETVFKYICSDWILIKPEDDYSGVYSTVYIKWIKDGHDRHEHDWYDWEDIEDFDCDQETTPLWKDFDRAWDSEPATQYIENYSE